MKTCTKCHEAKPLESFRLDQRGKGGYSARCKSCVAESRREFYAIQREHRLRPRRAREARVLAGGIE